MSRDIDHITEWIRRECAGVEVAQLRTKFAVDDDGIWFFTRPNCPFEVQLEAPHGLCPFLMETDEHSQRFNAENVEEAVIKLKQWLNIS